jgi:hypothetical protein
VDSSATVMRCCTSNSVICRGTVHRATACIIGERDAVSQQQECKQCRLQQGKACSYDVRCFEDFSMQQ